jgi:hypothetical protein
VNEDLIKEADFFRDIVIVPFADSYDLVVLKTVAICDYVVCSTRVDKHIIRVFQMHFVRVFMHMLSRFFMLCCCLNFQGSCCSGKVCHEV